MYDVNVNGGDDHDRATTTRAPAVMPIKQRARAGSRPDSRLAILMGRVARSEVPARRYWLRFLDAPMAKGFRDAGALDFDELVSAVPRVLRCHGGRVSSETVQEWWEFAMRRRWLEPVGPRCGLTEKAEKDLRAEYERVNSPDTKRLAGHVSRWVLPTGLAGAIGLISAKYLSIDLAIAGIAGVIIGGLLFAGAFTRATDPPMDRWFARRACDWLEGRPTTWALGANRKSADFSRLGC